MPSITVRVSDKTADRIDEVADAMDRTRSWVMADALNRYLDLERQWLEDIRVGIVEHDADEGISHDEAMARLNTHLDRLDGKVADAKS